MKILAFDTTNSSASVAILDDQNILTYQEELRPSMQAEAILPMIENALNEAALSYSKIDYLVVTNGPGSFTGIRIGLSVAKGILFGTKIQGIAISNFEIAYFMASRQVKNYDKIFVFLNGYRGQLYSQIFDQNGNSAVPTLIDYDSAVKLLKQEQGIIICTGSGSKFIYNQIKHIENIITLPRFSMVKALYICRYMAKTLEARLNFSRAIEPLYIRAANTK